MKIPITYWRRTSKTFIPKNEIGVVYLFSRHHEELGFEKIIDITTRFPDITALREGKEVKIELEFLLSSFKSHYLYRQSTEEGYWKWDEENEKWRIFNPRKNSFVEVSEFLLRLHDSALKMFAASSYRVLAKGSRNEFEVNGKGDLMYKTLKARCDCVICWEKDCEIEDGIEVIELKSFFAKRLSKSK